MGVAREPCDTRSPKAGQNGCRRHFGLSDQSGRSLASASLGGRRTRSGRSPQKASDSETRSRAAPPSLGVGSAEAGALHTSDGANLNQRFSFVSLALPACIHPLHPLYSHHANITFSLCLHPVGCRLAHPLLCWPHLRPCSTAQNA